MPSPDAASRPFVTRLEDVSDLRRWFGGDAPPDKPESLSAAAVPSPPSTVKVWHPTRRPPMTLISFADDFGGTAQLVRVRTMSFTIGRTEGDFLLPHDDAVSGRHAQLICEEHEGKWRWILRDLKSRNGTYARIAAAQLLDGSEILIGTRRLKFQLPQRTLTRPRPTLPAQSGVTQPLIPVQEAELYPTLRDIASSDGGAPVVIDRREISIGGEAVHCDLLIENDPFVSPKHARIYCNTSGTWWLENQASRNGTWLRVDEIVVDRVAEFQVGEQRFTIKVFDRAFTT